MRRAGEITIAEAAPRLEVHEDTVRNWAKAAVSGGRSRLSGAVRRDAAGYYWISKKRVAEIVDEVERGLAEYS